MKKQIYFYATAFILLFSLNRGQAQECDCLLPLDETFSVCSLLYGTPDSTGEYRNDDGYTAEITLPFTFNLYGTDYTTCFINNNGNVSFGNPYSTWTSSGFPIADFPMIAAFWADVDTRDLGSGLVYTKMLDNAMIVRWDHVGYFSMMSDKLNDFQIIISDGTSDLIPGGNNISFCYGDMQWTTGSASNGVDGFGGFPANVGANAGDGISFMELGMFDAAGNTYDGPNGAADGIDYLDYSHIYFSTNPVGANQPPIDVSNYCDTIIITSGDSTGFFFYDADDGQGLGFTMDTDYGQFLSISDEQPGMVMIDNDLNVHPDALTFRDTGPRSVILHVAANTPNGVYPFSITATDDGANPLSVTIHHVIQVGPAIVASVAETTAPVEVTAWFNANQLQFKGIKNSDITSINVYDVQGRNVFSGNRLNKDINTQTWPVGVYVFTLQTPQGAVSGRVVKQN